MSTLEIRLLGGFQVFRDGRPVERFESQKVRALLAYLASHADRPLSRDQLAGLLWPDHEQATARRNLRQALYNLRSNLGSSEKDAIRSAHQAVQLNPEIEYWLDVQAFDKTLERAAVEDDDQLRARELARASQLYRGDFLTGFFVKGSEAFEDWLVAEQERLRDAAIQTHKLLVETLRNQGEYRDAVRHARRLVEMDPLSEESHRELMQLYAISGRRSRALAQFEDLSSLLERELGVEPMPETRILYEQILQQDMPATKGGSAAEPLGPFVPLVGRQHATSKLREGFEESLRSGVRFTLITGAAGLGKTRLAKSVIHQLASQRHTSVLQGRSYKNGPVVSFQPFTEALHAALSDDPPHESKDPRSRLPELAAEIAGALPPVAEPAWRAPLESAPPRLRSLPDLTMRLFEAFCGPPTARHPMIVFLDDLQWADPSTFQLLEHLLDKLRGLPVWFLGTAHQGLDPHHPLELLLQRLSPKRFDLIPLESFSASKIQEISRVLIGSERSDELSDYLEHHGHGVPLHLVELINLLCDEGVLIPGPENRWSLSDNPPLDHLPHPESLDGLIVQRVSRLPTSARQLLVLAAVIGQKFDVGLLRRAAEEHIGVVEIGIELMLERWFIRQFPRYWTDDPRDRDVVLWARGARRGTFEFASYRIREAVYESLNPLRRQQMHHQVGNAFREIFHGREREAAEALAHHYSLAGEWHQALPYLHLSADKAEHLQDPETALFYCRRGRQAMARVARPDDSTRKLGDALQAMEERLSTKAVSRDA
ncbi:MAG: BTAD domain-containing putative transcriptional regulator [Acidobacteriota bacterium]